MALPARGRTLLSAAPVLQGLCLAGPTASGKSALAMALAQRWPIEIISVDSALVYRGMDIGTAKPSATERAAVPHHLIDIIDPTASYSAALFAAHARQLAAEIRARQRLPLLVGGTMLYFKALRDGISPMPSASADLRAQIDAEAVALGWPALHAQLAQVDPHTAARLAPRDAQRIQRALEVWRSSGRTLSDWHSQDRRDHRVDDRRHDGVDDGGVDTRADQQWPLLALEPQSRSWLHSRIHHRLQQMVAAGFLAEVQALRRRGDLHAGLPAMRCVGYRQAWQALEEAAAQGQETLFAESLKPATEQAWFSAALAATRQLAKRQLTWLRSIPSRTSLDCEAPDQLRQATHWLETKLAPQG